MARTPSEISSRENNPSGTFAIGGDLTVHRLGFGAMRITGPGIWGEPPAREAAGRPLRRVPELGIDLIDTADSYGPFVSEDLIRRCCTPIPGLVIATKGGLPGTGRISGAQSAAPITCASAC